MTLLDEESLMGIIINELANQFNFSYEIVNKDVDIDWGKLDTSTDELKFNGMVGMIQRNVRKHNHYLNLILFNLIRRSILVLALSVLIKDIAI
jgi:hypothetical protein